MEIGLNLTKVKIKEVTRGETQTKLNCNCGSVEIENSLMGEILKGQGLNEFVSNEEKFLATMRHFQYLDFEEIKIDK